VASVSTDLFAGSIATPVPIVPQSNTAKAASDAKRAKWTYAEAFKRNRGLITEEEQEKLRNSRVAIAGMGGVGGVHLITLARLGIGKFTIADPDIFEVANFNRQYGATISNLGRNKAEAMAEMALDINPELNIRVMTDAIDEQNAGEFLDEADLFVDSIDAFETSFRRIIFRRAAKLGLYAIGAGPVGFSTVWVTFAPKGMSFDDYFALTDAQNDADQFINYIVGMAPQATHRRYVDPSHVNISEQYGPSVGAACNLASGVLATDCVKLLLGRGQIRAAPYYQQFDPFVGKFVHGRLTRGNHSLMQRIKGWYIRKLLFSKGSEQGKRNLSF
jgi:molybdopterin/thiamine biosynthesis adenylyltransferase